MASWSATSYLTIPLKGSASALYNNFTFNGKQAAYAHLEDVHLVTLPRGGSTSDVKHSLLPVQPSNKASVTQVKWCQVSGKEFLVVTSVAGVQIWLVEASKLAFWHAVPGASDLPGWKPFLRGISSFEVNGDSYILCGSSTGDILAFAVDSSGTVSLSQTLSGGHQVPICEIDTSCTGDKATIVSSDQDGTINVWQYPGFTPKTTFKAEGDPCSSVRTRGNLVVAGFASGHIRLYDLTTNSICVEICAHSRFINAIELHPTADLFSTVSEDTYVNVWTLPTSSNSKVELKLSASVTDNILVGTGFVGSSRNDVAVASYDFETLRIFKST